MRKLLAMVFLALMAAIGWSAPATAQGLDRVKCESWQYQPARCAVPGLVDARISQVIAGDCRPSNWGQTRDGIYVSNGCRAWFAVRANNYNNGGGGGGGGGGGIGNTTTVRCESWQYKPARCGIVTNGSVRLQRVIAGDCRQGQTWGWDRSAIWVNGGCRADFAVSSNGGGWGGNGGSGGGQTIECSSWNYQPARCAVNNANSVQIEKVNGGECVLDRNWGWDRRSIWVRDGCRARFRVY